MGGPRSVLARVRRSAPLVLPSCWRCADLALPRLSERVLTPPGCDPWASCPLAGGRYHGRAPVADHVTWKVGVWADDALA